MHFAAYTNHIGFYPNPSAVNAFKKEFSDYEIAKGSIPFPLNVLLPIDFIKRIVEFRVKENLDKKI